MSEIRRLLLVKLSSLGDVVCALPLADALRAALPGAFLGWVVERRFAALLDGNPSLDAVYVLQDKGAGALIALGRALRAAGPFDAALDAQGLLVSGIATRLSGARRRIGFDSNREGNALFLTEPTVPAKGRRVHVVERLLGFCDALGLPRAPVRPQAYLADSDPGIVLPDGGSVVGFIVGASTADKAWPTERWAEAARILAERRVRVILLGGPGEIDAARAIAREANGAVASNLAGKTNLRALAGILGRCDAVIGGDSGPTHLAVAVGTPVVGLYGVTDPARTGPNWGASPARVLDFAEKDAPPEKRRARHPTLPDALARIPASAAAEAALSLLK